MGKWDRQTRASEHSTELIEQFTGATSDAVILEREACARLVCDGLRYVEIVQETEKQKITVKVRA